MWVSILHWVYPGNQLTAVAMTSTISITRSARIVYNLSSPLSSFRCTVILTKRNMTPSPIWISRSLWDLVRGWESAFPRRSRKEKISSKISVDGNELLLHGVPQIPLLQSPNCLSQQYFLGAMDIVKRFPRDLDMLDSFRLQTCTPKKEEIV